MSEHRTKIAVILGSTREGRFGPKIADWLVAEIERHGGFDVDLVDLATVELPAVMSGFGRPRPPAVEALEERLGAVDGFIVVTAEYNHSFPAPLKNAIDWFKKPWQAKPVAFVSYGGMSGGLRAVEQLRPIFGELHAVAIRDCVSFHNAQGEFAAEGGPQPSASRSAAVKSLLEQLVWWSRALSEARARRPYAV